VIAIVGKYTALKDAYLSLSHALKHAAFHLAAKRQTQVALRWVEAEEVGKDPEESLRGVHGILVPGGFGDRGVEGMIDACKYARTKKIPYLGICLGMQVAAIEWARNVLGLVKANSTEFDPTTPHPIVAPAAPPSRPAQRSAKAQIPKRDWSIQRPILLFDHIRALPEEMQKMLGLNPTPTPTFTQDPTDASKSDVGTNPPSSGAAGAADGAKPDVVLTAATSSGSAASLAGCVGLDATVGGMCLGSRRTWLQSESVAARVYALDAKEKAATIVERHRHRYELNLTTFGVKVGRSGLVVSGVDEANGAAHIIELPPEKHPFFFGVQYHPEFLSRPFSPSPPFVAFLDSAISLHDLE
jgi:CTP synthase (UTP-ammonia lyase)